MSFYNIFSTFILAFLVLLFVLVFLVFYVIKSSFPTVKYIYDISFVSIFSVPLFRSDDGDMLNNESSNL